MRPRRFEVWIPIVVVAVACAAAIVVLRLPAPAPSPAPSASAVVCPVDLRDIRAPPEVSEKVTYAIREPGGTVGWPLVRGWIAGCAVSVLLDTGVNMPVLAPWFADRLALARRPTDIVGMDLGARTAPTYAIDPTTLYLLASGTNGAVTAVLGGPDRLREHGVAAIEGPQFSVPAGRVMALDFAAGTFRKIASREEAERLVRLPQVFDVVGDCNQLVRVSVRIDGRPATLAIDTGSTVSVLFSGSDAAAPAVARVARWGTQEHTAFGGTQEQTMVAGIHLELGPISTLGPFSVWRTKGHVDEPCGFDGVLGTDFLIGRRCTLYFELGPEARDSGRYYTRTRGFCRP